MGIVLEARRGRRGGMKPPLLSMQFGGFGLLRELCSDHHCLILEHFHHSKKKSIARGSHFPSPSSAATPGNH